MALRAIWDRQNLAEVCRQQKVRRQTLVYWLDSYLHGGFDKLLERAPGASGTTIVRTEAAYRALYDAAPIMVSIAINGRRNWYAQ